MRNHGGEILTKVLSGGLALGMAGLLTACSGGSTASPTSAVLPGMQNAVKHGVSPDTVAPVYGGGSTFISLAARAWMDCYGVAIAPGSCSPTVNANVQLLYAAVGSGNALTAYLTQTPATSTPSNPPPFTSTLFPNYPYSEWDYSASDAPLSSTQISQYATADQAQRGNPIELPITTDGVTIPYNPSGLTVPSGGLQISVNTLCGIFTGSITNWNDSHITADNNGVQVSSNLPILVVHRSDGSGTTFLLSNHENTACASTSFPWSFGVGTTVAWPTTSGFIGEAGSQGVAGEVAATAGAIGYVGPGFLGPPNNIPGANLQDNYALTHPTAPKQYIAESTATVNNALHTVKLPHDPTPTDINNDTIIADSATKNAWPISGFSYIDFYQCYANKTLVKNIKGFVTWDTSTSLPQGQSVPDKLAVANGVGYMPTGLKQVTSRAIQQLIAGPKAGTCTI
jgi:phosphate transport system substrate-binding protein